MLFPSTNVLPADRSGEAEGPSSAAQSPNLNAYAERWVRSVKEECVAKLILFGERSLKRAMHHYELHYHGERNHPGNDNLLLFPSPTLPLNRKQGKIPCRERLGGLLKYYEREAA